MKELLIAMTLVFIANWIALEIRKRIGRWMKGEE